MNACAGRLSRVSHKPHALCRDCQLFWYGITGGIRPAWSETDGRAECGSRVHREDKVGDGSPSCAPTA